MTQVEEIRNSIIDKLLTISSPELLSAYNKILEQSTGNIVELQPAQIEMLKKSEEDIRNGDVISQKEINKADSEWLH